MNKTIYFIIIFSLFIHIFFAYHAKVISDTSNYFRVGQAILHHQNPYINLKDAYPYPPFYMFVLGVFSYLNVEFGLSFPFLTRIIPIFSFLLLGIVLLPKSVNERFIFATAYYLNPLLLLVTTILGQFDIAVLLFLILSINNAKKKPFLSGLFFAVSTLLKIYPLLVLPFFLFTLWKSRPGLVRSFLIGFLSLTLVFWLPFLIVSTKDVIRATLFYSGFADYGWGGIIRTWEMISGKDFIAAHLISLKTAAISKVIFIAWYVVLLLMFFRQKKYDLYRTSGFIFLSFLALYSSLSVQYLLWVVPFFLIQKKYILSFFYSIIAFVTGIYFFLFSSPQLLNIESISINIKELFILQIILYIFIFCVFFNHIKILILRKDWYNG